MDELPPTTTAPIADTTPLGPEYALPALDLVRAALRGNSVRPEEVNLGDFDGKIFHFDGTTMLALRTRTFEKITPGKKTTGEKVNGPQGVREAIDKEQARILGSDDLREQIKKLVLDRKDKGFAVRNEIIKLPFLTTEFVYHHPCNNCGAQGELKCQRCFGKGFQTCPKCNGQAMEMCYQCRGAQIIQNSNGNQTCPICHGQGRIGCRTCHQRRKIDCPTCNRHGGIKCQQCNGHAWNSYTTTAEMDVACNFVIDNDANMPAALTEIVEDLGKTLPEYAVIENFDVDGDRASEEIPVRYHVAIAYAKAKFKLGKNDEIPLTLVGTQAHIYQVPHFLEAIVKPGLELLHFAALGKGDVAEKIRGAGRYRTLRNGIIASAKFSKRKAAALLAKNTPLGMSNKVIKQIIINADRALGNVTAKPRRNGMMLGSAIAGVLYGAYLITPLRAMAVAFVPKPLYYPALDLVIFTLGVITAIFLTQISGAGAMKKALGTLLPEEEKKKVMPKAGKMAWAGLALCIVLFFTAAEASIHAGAHPPQWYAWARTSAGF